MKRRSMVAAFGLLPLAGCSTLTSDTAVNAARAGAIVLSAEDIAFEIERYINGDPVATAKLMAPDGPVQYALSVAEVLRGNRDVGVQELVLRYPTELNRFERKMLEGRAAVLEYADRTNQPVPIRLQYFWEDGKEVYEALRDIATATDAVQGIDIYRVARPYIILGARLAGVPVPTGI